MPKNFLVATFLDQNSLLQAVRAVRDRGFRIFDVYAPYPIHNLDGEMGIRRTRLPWVTLGAGGAALIFALLMQFYTAIWDWPLNVGGKPANSTLAFVPITFELTVLIGGLSTVAALFLRARLFPGKRESPMLHGVTDNTFALVLRIRDDSFDAHLARLLLEQSGVTGVEEKAGEL